MTPKFKTGDRIRVIRNSGVGLKIGDVHTVQVAQFNDGHYVYYIKSIRDIAWYVPFVEQYFVLEEAYEEEEII